MGGVDLTCGATVTGSTVGSSNNYGNPSGEEILRFYVERPGSYTVDACASSFDTYLRIFNDDMSTELSGCDDCGGCGTQSKITLELSVGYYNALIEGYRRKKGAFSITLDCPAPPPGGDLTIACGETVETSNVGAANVVGYESGDVVFDFTPSTSGQHTFATCGSPIDTVMRLYDGGLTSEITMSDDACGLQSQVTSTLTAGVLYKVVVEGYWATEGSISLSASCPESPQTPAPTNPLTEPPTTQQPTAAPTEPPTTQQPTAAPTSSPTTQQPTVAPTNSPTDAPTMAPTIDTLPFDNTAAYLQSNTFSDMQKQRLGFILAAFWDKFLENEQLVNKDMLADIVGSYGMDEDELRATDRKSVV